MTIAIIMAIVIHMENKEFFDTAFEQAKEYDWHDLQECRDVDPELPALTITTSEGKQIVCYKLK